MQANNSKIEKLCDKFDKMSSFLAKFVTNHEKFRQENMKKSAQN